MYRALSGELLELLSDDITHHEEKQVPLQIVWLIQRIDAAQIHRINKS
jgi:hypothetical protein